MVAVLLPRLLGHLASAALRALHSVVAHDRLDTDFEGESEQIAAAEAGWTPGSPWPDPT